MPRLGYIIVDSLAFVMAGVGLTAVVVGYESNLPAPFEQVAAIGPDWMDPVITGAITPKAKEAGASPAASQAEPTAVGASRSSGIGSRVWVDPPRHPGADGRADPAIDQAMGLRLARP